MTNSLSVFLLFDSSHISEKGWDRHVLANSSSSSIVILKSFNARVFSLSVQSVPALLRISTAFQTDTEYVVLWRKWHRISQLKGRKLYFHQEKSEFAACSTFPLSSFQYSTFSPNSAFWEDNSEKARGVTGWRRKPSSVNSGKNKNSSKLVYGTEGFL